jgi:NAD+ synthase
MINLPKLNYEEVLIQISNFLKKCLENSKAKGYVIGISGGVDSATTAYAACKTLGNEKLFALIMPEKGLTPEEDLNDAINVCNTLNLKYEVIEINEIKKSFLNNVKIKADYKTIGNLSPRIRMTLLYYYANSMNYLVLGTGDKSEILIGYFTKYGDGGVDALPLADLYKTQVREFASFLGVPQKIINKKSSPRLWPEHEAEKEIGISYDILDKILYSLVDLELSPKVIAEKLKIEIDTIIKIKERILNAEHKRRGPIILQLGLKSVETGYRLPVQF